jgi:biotin-(acetyl-CoA carboxylase) ligase
VHRGSVPAELSDDAACIDEPAQTVVPRRKILVGFLKHFQTVYVSFENGEHGQILESWKRCSTMWEDAQILIEVGGQRRSAVTCGLNEIGALMVENKDGSRETVVAGDVRIKRSPA